MAGYYSNYYNEFLMIEMKDSGLLNTTRNIFYVYVVLYLVLVAAGFWVQYWTLQKERAKELALATKVAQKQQQRKRLMMDQVSAANEAAEALISSSTSGGGAIEVDDDGEGELEVQFVVGRKGGEESGSREASVRDG